MRRLRPEPVLSDVVRARLEALLAEVVPRRAADADPLPDDEPIRRPTAASPDPEPHPDLDLEDAAPSRALRSAGEWRQRLSAGFAFGRSHLVVVGIIAAAGLAWSGWSMAQARTVPVAIATPVASAPLLTPAPSASATPSVMVKVHVLGAVVSPGVVALPIGSRVEDAIAAAGGMTAEARPGDLNLAAPVTDGAQLRVGDASRPTETSAPAGDEASGATGGALLDLNTATSAQLEELPGVGPVTAAAILAWRSQHGRFSTIEELQEVDGIGPRTYESLSPLVRV